jgi:hypothetical protein
MSRVGYESYVISSCCSSPVLTNAKRETWCSYCGEQVEVQGEVHDGHDLTFYLPPRRRGRKNKERQ